MSSQLVLLLAFTASTNALVGHSPRLVPCARAQPGHQRSLVTTLCQREDSSKNARLSTAYVVAGGATTCAWAACAVASLATYKPHRIVHNSIGVAGALTALPMIWGSFGALAIAVRGGRVALRQPQYRRLNLGLAAASIWATAGVVFSKALTAAVVRTSDPVIYPPLLASAAVLAHLATAALCLVEWRRAVPDRPVSRLVHGVVQSSPMAPTTTSGSGSYSLTISDWVFSPSVARVAAYATLSLCFGGFAALSALVSFPLATVPSLLGKRLARAHGAWNLLAAVGFFTLMEMMEEERRSSSADGDGGDDDSLSAQRAECHSALEAGAAFMALAHLAVMVARRVLESATVYPAAMACLPAVVASLAVYVLVLQTTWGWFAFWRQLN